MNKTDAMERLDAIEREAKELRRIIEAPEQTWKPEDLVGKLCYVWDGGMLGNKKYLRCVTSYSQEHHFHTGVNAYWHAEPVPVAEAEKMIYRKSRYDWSKAPARAKYAATDANGKAYFWDSKPEIRSKGWDSGFCNVIAGADILEPRPDWRDSLERRP